MKNPQFPAGVKPSVQAVITEESGKRIQLSNKDFLANSLCFKTGTTDQGSFTVGGGIIGSVSFSLINEGNLASAINYVNAAVEISLTAGGQTVDMGKYWFVDHTGNNNLVKCDAYDALQIFDEHQLYESSITYPTTAKSLAQKLVTARGFKISGLPTVDVPINNPQNNDMTERECLRYLAQLLGMYVVAKGDTIVFGTYSRTTKHDAGTSFSHNLRTEAITITDVVVNANKQQAQQTAGTGGYVVTVDNNPFVNEQNTALVQANLDKNIKGLSFHPGTYDIKANPAIDAGDCLLVQTRDAQYTAYVTNISYKIQLQQAIKSDADNYIGDRRISKKPKTFIEIVKNATQSQISNDLKNPNSELSQAIGQGGSGSGAKSRYQIFDKIATPFYDISYVQPSHLTESVRLVVMRSGACKSEYHKLKRLDIQRFNIPVIIDEDRLTYEVAPGSIFAACNMTIDVDGEERFFRGSCTIILENGTVKKGSSFDVLQGWLEVANFHGVVVNQPSSDIICISAESVDYIRINNADIRIVVKS